jgi:hypothetical protein
VRHLEGHVGLRCSGKQSLLIVGITLCGGLAVASLLEALLYKREGSGFDSRWSHRNFSFT